MIKKLKYFIFAFVLTLPVFQLAHAEDAINSFVDEVRGWIGLLTPTLIALALVFFLFGVLRYLFSKDGVSQKEAKQFMLWGIIALFVMVSVWGLVKIIQQVVLGDDANVTNPLPTPIQPWQKAN